MARRTQLAPVNSGDPTKAADPVGGSPRPMPNGRVGAPLRFEQLLPAVADKVNRVDFAASAQVWRGQ